MITNLTIHGENLQYEVKEEKGKIVMIHIHDLAPIPDSICKEGQMIGRWYSSNGLMIIINDYDNKLQKYSGLVWRGKEWEQLMDQWNLEGRHYHDAHLDLETRIREGSDIVFPQHSISSES